MRIVGQLALWVSVVMVFSLGCSSRGHPITNVENAPVPTATGKTLTADEVQKAIMRAGTMTGWVIQPEQPGRLMGRSAFGAGERHVAVVTIQYDAKSYSINYRDSVNLNADTGMNQIHRAYNEKVSTLDRAIRNELTR